jgi:hypothetical protein
MKILKEPLAHFLILCEGIFVYAWISGSAGSAERLDRNGTG